MIFSANNKIDPTQIYLFDWGDTLMVDFPASKGKMCSWDIVSEVRGASDTLKSLSMKHKIYIATGAAESCEQDIEKALTRVDLNQYISGYFCQSNLGVGKESPEFFQLILKKLKIPAHSIVMVGDSYARDIEPAIDNGINAIWFNPNSLPVPNGIESIVSLRELCNYT